MIEDIAKQIGRPVDLACSLLENILDVPTQKIGDLLGDRVSYWQWTNRLAIADSAAERLRSLGCPAHALPMDFAIPFLRDSGDVSDERLRNWWSELLASAVQDHSFAHIAFVNTLHSLSPTDVQFLDALLHTAHVGKDGRIEAVVGASSLTPEQARMSFHNLERLGFFTPTGKRLKGFAFALLRACVIDRNLVDAYAEKQKSLASALVVD